MHSIFAVRTTVAAGRPGNADLARSANFSCADFNSAALGVLVAAVIAGTAMGVVGDAGEIAAAERVVGATVITEFGLLVTTPAVELTVPLDAVLVISMELATTSLGKPGRRLIDALPTAEVV